MIFDIFFITIISIISAVMFAALCGAVREMFFKKRIDWRIRKSILLNKNLTRK